MSTSRNVSPVSQNREFFYNANADAPKSRIMIETGQELVQYHQDTSVRIWYNDLSADYDPHWHTALEIIMPVENWYDIYVGDGYYHATPGDIMLIPPGELHSLKAPEEGNRFVFMFDLANFSRLNGFASIQSILAQPMLLTRATYPNVYDDIYEILVQMRNEYFSKKEFAELTICSLLLNLFVKLGTNHLDNIDLFSNIRVYKQKEYVQDNLQRDL